MSAASAFSWTVEPRRSICGHDLKSVRRRISCMLYAEVGGSPATVFSAEQNAASSAIVLLHEAPAAARNLLACSSRCRMTTAQPSLFVVPPVTEPSLQMVQSGAGRAARAHSAACLVSSKGSARRVVVSMSTVMRTDPG